MPSLLWFWFFGFFFAVVLCLDSVLIDCHGRILFSTPKAEGKTRHCMFSFYFFSGEMEKKANILPFVSDFFSCLESCDVFYLAPEIEEEDVDTEKVMW